MHLQLETLTADAALRSARSPRARVYRHHPEDREAAAMLAAARRIVATTRVAFADAGREARVPAHPSGCRGRLRTAPR
jgi:hypothetical protein